MKSSEPLENTRVRNNPKTNERGKLLRCFSCGKVGHISRNCEYSLNNAKVQSMPQRRLLEGYKSFMSMENNHLWMIEFIENQNFMRYRSITIIDI